jgi:hypothetical protein
VGLTCNRTVRQYTLSATVPPVGGCVLRSPFQGGSLRPALGRHRTHQAIHVGDERWHGDPFCEVHLHLERPGPG